MFKILIIGDSAMARRGIQDALASESDIQIALMAAEPGFVLDRVRLDMPAAIVFDLDAVRLNTIDFIRQLLARVPVVGCADPARLDAVLAVEALASGMSGIVHKVDGLIPGAQMVLALRKALRYGQGPCSEIVQVMNERRGAPKLSADAILPPLHAGVERHWPTEKVVAIGASTGGTQAIEDVLLQLPHNSPAIVIVQHMPEKFTGPFANRLNTLCKIEVKEAVHGDKVMAGRALIAPGGKHMLLKRSGSFYHVELMDGPLITRHRPSVDVLFRSTAQAAGGNAVGVLMTGMGDDGAVGLKEMRDCGAKTCAQDEASCVVFGMPKEGIKLGGACDVLPLSRIHEYILRA